MILDFDDTDVSQTQHMYIAHWGIDEIPQRGQVYDYVLVHAQVEFGVWEMNERKV